MGKSEWLDSQRLKKMVKVSNCGINNFMVKIILKKAFSIPTNDQYFYFDNRSKLAKMYKKDLCEKSSTIKSIALTKKGKKIKIKIKIPSVKEKRPTIQ